MDGVLFEKCVREMDKKFVTEERKVALVINNCPAHPQIENLKSIMLFFLPPNTTSQTQPVDQGVIRSLKAQYHNNVVRKIIRSVEKKKTLSKISLLLEMQMLVAAWDAVMTKTVVNCFGKSKISRENQKKDVSNDQDDVIETEHQPVYCPYRNEPLQIIKTTQKFSLFSKDGAIVQSYANDVARIIDQHFAEKNRQTTIRDYFESLKISAFNSIQGRHFRGRSQMSAGGTKRPPFSKKSVTDILQ